MKAKPRSLRLAAVLATATLLALPAAAQAADQALTVELKGTATGSVASSPAGIACGLICSAPFAEGSTVSLSAAPGAGAAAVIWSGCGKVNLENECSVTMSAAKTVTATFNPIVFRELSLTKVGSGTVSSVPAGIACGATCSASYPNATVVTLTAVPGPGAEAVKWSGCTPIAAGKCEVAMSAAKAVTATFDPPKPLFALSVTKTGTAAKLASVSSAPAGIACGAVCGASFPQGQTATLIALPGPHTKAVQWTGCTKVIAGACEVTMSEAKAVSAGFAFEAGYALNAVSIKKAGSGQGTVSGAPGSILCGALCSDEFLTATPLTLTAAPAPGSVFAHWSGGGCKGTAPCTMAVKAPVTVKAVFTAVGTRTMTVTKAGSGQGTVTSKAAHINCGAACSSQVAVRHTITLSAKPAAGSTFAGWSGACAGTKACKLKMSEAKSVTATFSAIPKPPGPPAAKCVVPRLAGKSLKKARRALGAAHCALGRVRGPKGKRVRSFAPAAGTVLGAGSKVSVRLGPRAKKTR